MNTIQEQLKKSMESTKLSDAERSSMRALLVAEIEASRKAVTNKKQLTQHQFKKIMPIGILIALLLSGGVSYAAEGTAPGDALYPVKIHVNENVRGALAVSDIAKAKLEVDLAERRLSEVEKLKQEDRLNATTTQELKVEFESHRGRADGHLKNLEGSHRDIATAIANDFTLRLEEHQSALDDLGIDEDERGDDSTREGRGDDEDGRGRNGSNEDGRSTVGASTSIQLQSRSSEIDSRGELEIHRSEGEHSDNGELRGRESEGESEDDDEDEGGHKSGSGAVTLPVTNVIHTVTSPTISASFTLAQVATHNNQSSCYSIVSGSVYDLTSFTGNHPGGDVILSMCGKDGTALFMAQHGGSGKPERTLAGLKVGTFVQ